MIVNPCGFVVLELISDTLTMEVEMTESKPRMVWKEWNNDYIAEGEYLTPIKVTTYKKMKENNKTTI